MQVQAMVRVLVGHDDRVDVVVRHVALQLGERPGPEVEHQVEPLVPQEVPAAGPAGPGERAVGAEDRQLHTGSSTGATSPTTGPMNRPAILRKTSGSPVHRKSCLGSAG